MTQPGLPASSRGASNLTKTVGSQAATLVVLTVAGVVVPRLLGVDEYGRYAAILGVVAMMQAASSLGLQQVQLRYLPPLWQRADRREAVALASSIWSARLGSSLLAGVAACLWLGGGPDLGVGFGLCVVLALLCCLRGGEQATRNFFLPLGHPGKGAGLELLRVSASFAVLVVAYARFGLSGVFVGLAMVHAGLLALEIVLLRRVLPIRPLVSSFTNLRPHLRYSLSSYGGQTASVVHERFTVYAVAVWIAPREAGILAVGVQIYSVARDLFLAARRSLMPILAEIEEAGQPERLRYWGDLMMRYGAAGGTLGVMVWSLLGGVVVRGLLGGTFSDVHRVAAIILIGTAFFFCGSSCIGLLYTKEMAGIVALNTVAYALVAIGGLLLVVQGEEAVSAGRIAWIYAGSALVYFGTSYGTLGLVSGVWLPLRRTVVLLLPLALALPAVSWAAGSGARLGACLLGIAVYLGLAIALRLLPWEEVRRLAVIGRGSLA